MANRYLSFRSALKSVAFGLSIAWCYTMYGQLNMKSDVLAPRQAEPQANQVVQSGNINEVMENWIVVIKILLLFYFLIFFTGGQEVLPAIHRERLDKEGMLLRFSMYENYINKFVQIPLLYSDSYNIAFLGFEKLHPFDSCKYKNGNNLFFLQEILFFLIIINTLRSDAWSWIAEGTSEFVS